MAYTNIDDPSAHFQTATYTGGGGGSSVTNDGNSDLKPDLVWFATREGNYKPLIDSTRGGNKFLYSDLSQGADTGESGVGIATFNTDGFTFGSTTQIYFNNTSKTYVAWQWKANGGTTASNSNGSITSTVQANTDAGFSIVTYTGTGSGNANPSVGHGLGVTPQVVLVKGRSQANSWIMYNYAIDGANSRNKYLVLNSTGAAGTLANYWGTAASGGVTSSTFGVYADNQSGNNYLNGTHVAYCFAEKQGYSKFGSYVGNGNADGTFVYTGFKPAFVLVKNTSSAYDWRLLDSARNTFNAADLLLMPNNNSAEFDGSTHGTNMGIDFVSNGFKLRTTYSGMNNSGHTFIYMAFAENPFVTSTGIPTTAR
jgi:hypothetical protein